MTKNMVLRVIFLCTLYGLIIYFLVSCGNRRKEKERIVNRQMELKKEIITQEKIERRYEWLAKFTLDLDSIKSLAKKSADAAFIKDSLQNLYDSLEMELKKY